MKRKFLLLVSLAAFGLSAAAHASTITAGIYSLNDAFVNGYAVTGTVDLNSSGNVTLADLTFNDASFDNPGLPTFNQIEQTNAYNGLSQNYLTSSNLNGQLDFYFNTTADANGDLDLCIGNAQCGTSNGTTGASALHIYWVPNSTNGTYPVLSNAEFSSGYLAQVETPATALTPEPSSLILLGTGIIGLAGATRFLR